MAKHNKDGQVAEDVVTKYLEEKGYKILDNNWKTRFCEIDIIASNDGVVHFVEVKYRGSDSAGQGFDYITPSKIRQMGFAAELWVSKQKYSGEYVLSAAQVNRQFKVDFIEEI